MVGERIELVVSQVDRDRQKERAGVKIQTKSAGLESGWERSGVGTWGKNRGEGNVNAILA